MALHQHKGSHKGRGKEAKLGALAAAGAVSLEGLKKRDTSKLVPAKKVRASEFSPTEKVRAAQTKDEGPVLGKRLAAIAAGIKPGKGRIAKAFSGALSGAAIGANIGEALAEGKKRRRKKDVNGL